MLTIRKAYGCHINHFAWSQGAPQRGNDRESEEEDASLMRQSLSKTLAACCWVKPRTENTALTKNVYLSLRGSAHPVCFIQVCNGPLL